MSTAISAADVTVDIALDENGDVVPMRFDWTKAVTSSPGTVALETMGTDALRTLAWLEERRAVAEDVVRLSHLLGQDVVALQRQLEGVAGATRMSLREVVSQSLRAAMESDVRGTPISRPVHRVYAPPDQLPAREALALLAVSRDADEQAPDEHRPGSRGDEMRRAVGIDVEWKRRSTRKSTRAMDRPFVVGRSELVLGRLVTRNDRRRAWWRASNGLPDTLFVGASQLRSFPIAISAADWRTQQPKIGAS